MYQRKEKCFPLSKIINNERTCITKEDFTSVTKNPKIIPLSLSKKMIHPFALRKKLVVCS